MYSFNTKVRCLTVVLGVSGVAVYDSRQQHSGENPCNGAPCSDQCVVSFTDYKCIRQKGVQLLNDEHTCEDTGETSEVIDCIAARLWSLKLQASNDYL